jgi:hypothetical protein
VITIDNRMEAKATDSWLSRMVFPLAIAKERVVCTISIGSIVSGTVLLAELLKMIKFSDGHPKSRSKAENQKLKHKQLQKLSLLTIGFLVSLALDSTIVRTKKTILQGTTFSAKEKGMTVFDLYAEIVWGEGAQGWY